MAVPPAINVLHHSQEHLRKFRVGGAVRCLLWGIRVITKRYVARQVAALLEFAKSTKNTTLSAVLIERAADLKLRIDEAPKDANNDLAAPDVVRGK